MRLISYDRTVEFHAYRSRAANQLCRARCLAHESRTAIELPDRTTRLRRSGSEGIRSGNLAVALTRFPTALLPAPRMVHGCARSGTHTRVLDFDRGRMAVWNWPLFLSYGERRNHGDGVRMAEFGWPVGMPLCRSIRGRKWPWEIKSSLGGGRIARVIFCIHEGNMVLLHGIIKKSWQAQEREIGLVAGRMRGLQ